MKKNLGINTRRRNLYLKLISISMCLMLLLNSIPIYAFVPPTDSETSASLRSGFSDNPDKYEIYPVPHSITYLEGDRFYLSNTVNIVYEEEIDEYTVDFLKEVLEKYGLNYKISSEIDNNGSNILLGVVDSNGEVDNIVNNQDNLGFRNRDEEETITTDSSINMNEFITTDSSIKLDFNEDLFGKIDAYMLNAQENIITILGKDTDSVFHGIATLQMMFSSFAGRYFLPVHIEDWAEMEYRGIVEGFYGEWDFPGRESLMRSSRDVKMNTFVYAAKGDEYHRSKWAELYPDDEIRKMKRIVEVGKETKVDFVWSVHLEHFFKGISIKNNPEEYEKRYNQLIRKFDQLYDIGVRRFDVLNDDFGSGSHEEVVQLLNRLMVDYVDEKGDVDPIIYCPQGYNVNWSGSGSELEVLKGLDKRIKIFWTGQDVNSPIAQNSIDYLIDKTGLDPVFWINYPVNEHAKSGIFLGEISHYVRDGVTGLAGAVSNPSWFTETNKVGLFQLASLFWNNQNYSNYVVELWENSFKYLQPEVYESYLTIGRNVSNAPNSSRVGDNFPESEYIKSQLHQILDDVKSGKNISNNTRADKLLEEFDNILYSIEDFRNNVNNEKLKEELEPWLKSLNDVVTACQSSLQAVIALEEDDIDKAWTGLFVASKALSTWDKNGVFPNESREFAKAGSKRLHPFATELTNFVKDKLTPILNPGDVTGSPSFYGVMGGKKISDSDNTAKMFDKDPSTYASFRVIQKKDDYFGVDFGKKIPINNILILQGKDDNDHDYFHKATLEYSTDGKTWNTLISLIDSTRIKMNDLDIKARYLRLRLVEAGTENKPDYWTFIREFTVNEKESLVNIYTNVEELTDSSVVLDGGNYILTNNRGKVTLNKDEYLGVNLGEIIGVSEISISPNLPEGLTLEYSVNQAKWFDISSLSDNTPVRYVRIINNGDEETSFNFNKLQISVSAESIEISPKLDETNLENDLKGGSWENLFDGDYSSYIWTNEPQKEGQYIIFDLGVLESIYDVTLITDDGKPRIYNGTISISDDKQVWDTIVTVENSDVNGEGTIDPPYRYIRGDGEGRLARYIKIEITSPGPDLPYLKLHELEINKDVEDKGKVTAFSGKPIGKFENAIDGDVSTIFSPGEIDIEDGYFQYILSENVNIKSISILQNPNNICNAEVKVQSLEDEWFTLGELDKSANTFDVESLGGVQKLRLEWKKNTNPAIAEIFLSTEMEEDTSDEVEEDHLVVVHPNIVQVSDVDDVVVNNGTPWDLVGLPQEVYVTLSNSRRMLLPVEWSSEDYSPFNRGKYAAVGKFILPDNIINPAELTLKTSVTVKGGANDEIEGNIALNSHVEVSGVEVGTNFIGENIVDNDLNTRWSANKMKDRNDKDVNNQNPGANWAIIDLGEGNNEIQTVRISYHAKASGTKYEIQTSDDKTNWKTIGEVNKEANDKIDAVHTIDIENHSSGRYLRIYYNELNVNALAATGVSIKEVEVIGKKSFEVNPDVIKVDEQDGYGIIGDNFADLSLPERVVATLADGSKLSLAVQWEDNDYDHNLRVQKLTGNLELPRGVSNSKDIKATLNLTLNNKPQVVSATLVEKTVAYGYSFNKLKLPSKIVVEVDDGFSRIFDVKWMSDSYNPYVEGEQTLKGVLALPDSIGNNQNIYATVKITVLPRVIDIGELEKEVTKIEGKILSGELVKEDYTNKSWRVLDRSLKAAKELLKGNPNQIEITNALIDLRNAVSNLKEVIPPVVVDMSPSKPSKPSYIIEGNGEKIKLKEKDIKQGKIDIKITPNKKGVVSVEVPVNTLKDIQRINPELLFNLETVYGSYQIPVNIDSLYKDIDKLTSNNINSKDLAVVISMNNKSMDKTTKELIKSISPNSRILSNIIDYSVDIINKNTNDAIKSVDRINGDVRRTIAILSEIDNMPEKWGAFYYDDANKLIKFVPAKSLKVDDEWFVSIDCNKNGSYLILENDIKFIDVKDNHWAVNTIEMAAAKGLVDGVGRGLYEPNRLVTRAEFIQFIANGIELIPSMNNVNPYLDVLEGAWYYNTIKDAKSAGLLTHFNQKEFNPNLPITREEMASVLADVLRYKNVQDKIGSNELENVFSDFGKINLDLQDDVQLIYNHGIMRGMSDSEFDPKGIATRAQAVSVQIDLLKTLGMIE